MKGKIMKITNKSKPLNFKDYSVGLSKDNHGVVTIEANNLNEKAFAMGVLHATDRPFQMELTRLVAQGKLCQSLKSNKENLEIDIFMKSLNLYKDTEKEQSFLDEECLNFFKAYCEGVDYIFQEKQELPRMFKLLKHKPAPWEVIDIMAITKLMSYVGLAQSQQDVEKLIIDSIQKDVSIPKLKSIFKPHLDELTQAQVELIKKVKVSDNILPNKISKFSKVPLIKGSNNWIVSGSHTLSGRAHHAFDPHLECNRLPAIWYEFKCKLPDNSFVGINMPGVPGVIMGRSQFTAFSFTYGFMDTIDYFVEEIKDGKYRTAEGFEEVDKRVEGIGRKKSSELIVNYFSTSNGTLEIDPNTQELEDGYYLARAWSGNLGAAGSLNSLYKILKARNAKDLQESVKNVAISCNWLLTDSEDNIAYQQSGRAPKRFHSGLHPVEGWIKENQWDGALKTEELASHYNPECGYIVTANDDKQVNTSSLTVNLHMGPNRASRIEELLQTEDKLALEDHKFIQNDLYSNQAEEYIKFLGPILPSNSPHTLTLKSWNFKYDKSSRAAVIFEKIYSEVFHYVFGENFLGKERWRYLEKKTAIIEDFFHYFDKIILNPSEAEKDIWFNGQSSLEFIAPIVSKTIHKIKKNRVKKYADNRKIVMKNVFIGNILPGLLKQNYGPIIFEGSRATVNHHSIFKAHGRISSFAPSYRHVSDMGENYMYTILAGGQSEHRKSPNYCDQVESWLSGKYKKLEL